ncbi:putative RecF/RecN/SMC N terminal domain [Candidatus Sulfopaludibacter sp. SbA4]|nr:putative RecF/RecN/SMC N terminal domain [Candidatus Sulfopaludibacter sp. SbA4]
MLGDKRFLRTIKLQNILSFGPDTPEFELLSLNVLVGANGAGKSNLIEAISLLQATPRDLLEPVRTGGGIAEWLWKGSDQVPIAEMDTTVSYPEGMPLRHKLKFTMVGQRLELVDEAIEDERHPPAGIVPNVNFYYRYYGGHPVLKPKAGAPPPARRQLRRQDLALDQSVLSQRKDPDQYPELTYLGSAYSKIRLFREWNLGRNTQPRRPQPTDLAADFLLEDASNVALVLNNIEGLRASLVERLKDADESIKGISTKVSGGTIQVFLHYSGLPAIPATRLSDGTIRYLSLLAILCHPDPPPLVCLEEPELGLHPDLLPRLADLLVEASHRLQLIVTTHSDVLVDGLTKTPEAVVVCEKQNGSTKMGRRTGAELTKWLEDYGLGQLWRRGEIGGNRW